MENEQVNRKAYIFRVFWFDFNDKIEYLRIKAYDIEDIINYLKENEFAKDISEDEMNVDYQSDEFASVSVTVGCTEESEENCKKCDWYDKETGECIYEPYEEGFIVERFDEDDIDKWQNWSIYGYFGYYKDWVDLTVE